MKYREMSGWRPPCSLLFYRAAELVGFIAGGHRVAAHEAARRATYGAGRWRDFPALLASGGVWLNSAAPQTTPALIRPPLRCSAVPKGGTARSAS
jgi:hypothetical protein